MIGFRHAALAAISLASGTPLAAQPATQVINVWSFGFAPRPIQLAAGRPVTLVFVNSSGSSHDFTAPAFFANSVISAGAAPAGEIELHRFFVLEQRSLQRPRVLMAQSLQTMPRRHRVQPRQR